MKIVMRKRPITTLFMLESLDGKINSGKTDNLDVDKDWCRIEGVKEGLGQYYDIEQTTDLFSLNSGRVMAKIGVNERTDTPRKSPCSFIIIDNKPHLTEAGIAYLSKWVEKLYLVTTNPEHPVYSIGEEFSNVEVLGYEVLDLETLLFDLYEKHGIEYLTIQSGGTMNGAFLRLKLFDFVDVVVAPLLVGGFETPTLIDGESITTPEELQKLCPLELIECKKLNNSYIHLRYKVKR